VSGGLIDRETLAPLLPRAELVGKMLRGLIGSIESSQ
jgi:hypothetical protein